MTARVPEKTPLVGTCIRLDPFEAADLPGLWRALGHPEVFAGGYGGGPAGLPENEAAFAEWAPRYFPHEQGVTFVVRIASGPHEGEIVGASSLADFELHREAAHIGWTGFAPWVWATQVNVEAKLLMLQFAFDHGFGRVKLQADARNSRSRAAIAKLGATFEGIARRDARRADGTWRDAAIFSITIDDWPEVRTALQRRLDDWEGRPVEFVDHPTAPTD